MTTTVFAVQEATVMDLSTSTITAIGAVGVLLIGAFFAGLVSALREWNTVAGKVAAIEGHVNSDKTADLGKIATLTRENELLREMLADRKNTAEVLAQAEAMAKAAAATKKEP